MSTRPLALLTNEDGTPKLAELSLRASQSMPGRMKVTFTANVENGLAVRKPDGDLQTMAIPDGASGSFAFCDEFRLEMS